MTGPALADHALVVVLAAVLPIHVTRQYRRMVRRIRADVPDVRAHDYRSTMVRQWALAAVVLVLWWNAGRPAELLGFSVPGGIQGLLGASVVIVGLTVIISSWRSVMKLDEAGLAEVRAQFESVADFMPRTTREAVLFRRLSVTAGICEEIVYRGYLIWYLGVFLGAWPAAVVAGAVFGLLHIYQGIPGAIRTGAVGLFMSVLFVATGSLLWPMVLHTAIDLQGGAMARRALVTTGS